MNIFDYAMEMEKDGEAYYRENAAKTEHEGVRNILLMLADAELLHYEIFEKMKADQDVAPTDSAFLDKVKNVFAAMRAKGVPEVGVSEADMYRRALELEEKTRDFYLGKADETDQEGQKKIFLDIAAEEKRHARILENIVDFVTRPEQWIEDAEWHHLESY